MKKRILGFLLIVLGIILLFGLAVRNSLSVWSSPERQFNVTPDNIWLNWTTQDKENITITANESFNITVEILSENTNIVPIYWETPAIPLSILVMNESGEYTNTIGPINGGSSSNITLIGNYSEYLPGRYFGGLTIRNNTDVSENLTINLTVDIPISFDESDGMGIFIGTFPANATSYHSYYFNTSGILNATAAFIVLSSESRDMNFFLFDQYGKLKEKSIYTAIFPGNPPETPYSGFLLYSYLPENEMWEIRIYGNISNSSDYFGGVFLNTLNATDTDSGERIELIDFGDLNASDSKSSNITLKNEGNLTVENIELFTDMPAIGPSESGNMGFYHEDTFQESGDREFDFLATNDSIEIIAVMNWTGSSSYNISIYKPDGSLFKSSYNESNNAKITNATREEFVLVNSSDVKEGFWKIKIKNTTLSAENYTLKIWMFYNSGQWFTISPAFIQQLNATMNVSIVADFTTPNNLPDGVYRGNLMVVGNDAPSLVIPFEFNLTTPMLFVNNSLRNSTIKIDENIGSNLTKEFSIIINNTGTYDFNLTTKNSSVLSKDSTHKMGLSYSAPETIPAHSSGLLNVTIDINTVNTSDVTGQYRGWAYLNASDSHPYQGFNLTIQVNLTNQINVEVIDIVTNNSGSDDNVIFDPSLPTVAKIVFNVFYVNGTQITGDIICNNVTNFKKIWLYEPNASYTYPTSGNLTYINSTETCDDPQDSGNYTLNITIPAGRPGGSYEIHALVNTTGNKLTGESDGPEVLVINNTGLKMSIVGDQPPYSMVANTTKIINVSINNYGLLEATNSSIRFMIKGCLESSSYYSYTNCNVSASGTRVNISSIPSGNTSWCYVAWNIKTVGSADSCTPTINGTAGVWFGNLSLGITVTEANETTPITPTPNITTPGYNYSLIFTKAESLILIKQNSTNSTVVVVKNIGNITQLVNFSILTLSSSWFTLNATSANISANSSATFLVTFRVGIVDMSDYGGTFKAASRNKTITSDFTLRVLPSDANRTYINDMITSYRTQMLNFSNVINQSKQQGYNTSDAESHLQDLIAKIQEAEGYISQNDYGSAYLTLGLIESLLGDTRDAIAGMEKTTEPPQGGTIFDMLTLIIIGVGVISVIVLAYLFWPSKAGYAAGKKKYVYKTQGEEARERLKEKWMEIIKKKK